MKKVIYLGLVLISALAVLGTACTQGGNVNTSSSMNQNMMNHNGMTSGNMANHKSMTMNSNVAMQDMMSTMKSDPNAASAPYDLQFIDTMSVHHQGAVEMAGMALKKSQNAELKTFAQKIIDDQQKEIAQMKAWREKWYAGKAPAKNMEMSGMMDSMKIMARDRMKMMEAMNGKDFDIHFLDMMTPHHTGAVTMAKEALTKAEQPELKTLANQIIKSQEAEIKMMADWKAKWSK